MSEKLTHPMESFSCQEKESYMSVAAKICVADGSLSTEEAREIELLARNLGLDDSPIKRVMQAVFSDEPVNTILDRINFSEQQGRFSLISDLFYLALADGEIALTEKQYIDGVARYIGISENQVDAIFQVQLKMKQLKALNSSESEWKGFWEEAASTLGGVGVPLAAVCVSGVWGLGAIGLTSGLAALGAIIGGGMLAGIVVVVPTLAIAGAWVGKQIVDWVYNFIWPEKK